MLLRKPVRSIRIIWMWGFGAREVFVYSYFLIGLSFFTQLDADVEQDADFLSVTY